MILNLTLRLLVVVLICVCVLDLLERFNPNPPALLVQADYSECATVKNGPLVRRTKPVLYPHNSELS